MSKTPKPARRLCDEPAVQELAKLTRLLFNHCPPAYRPSCLVNNDSYATSEFNERLVVALESLGFAAEMVDYKQGRKATYGLAIGIPRHPVPAGAK